MLVESGYFGADKMLELRGRGAVGDTLGRVVDAEGGIADAGLDARAIVLAALRARYVNVPVTDEATAQHVMERQDG